MKDREIFEKETGIKLKPATGSGLLWQEYAEWREKRSGWVSVEDMLPKDGEVVDIWANPGDQYKTFRRIPNCMFRKHEKGFDYRHGASHHLLKYPQITHWRYEPTPPDEAKRGRG